MLFENYIFLFLPFFLSLLHVLLFEIKNRWRKVVEGKRSRRTFFFLFPCIFVDRSKQFIFSASKRRKTSFVLISSFERSWSKIMDFSPRWKRYKMKVLDEYRTDPMSASLDRVTFVDKKGRRRIRS
jgi:hypothetical protein